MNFKLIISITINQSLAVFPDSLHSFYIFRVQKLTFLVKKIVLGVFYQIEVQMFTNWSRRLKITKHLKFDIQRIFYASLKKVKKITFSENRQEHTLKSLYAFFLI